MNTKHSPHRRTSLLSGMPHPSRLPRKPLQTGARPSSRDPNRTCRFTERVGLSDAELDQIAERINTAGLADPAAVVFDPVLSATGAPTLKQLNAMLDEAQADLGNDDLPGRPDEIDNDDYPLIPAARVLDMGTIDFPGMTPQLAGNGRRGS